MSSHSVFIAIKNLFFIFMILLSALILSSCNSSPRHKVEKNQIASGCNNTDKDEYSVWLFWFAPAISENVMLEIYEKGFEETVALHPDEFGTVEILDSGGLEVSYSVISDEKIQINVGDINRNFMWDNCTNSNDIDGLVNMAKEQYDNNSEAQRLNFNEWFRAWISAMTYGKYIQFLSENYRKGNINIVNLEEIITDMESVWGIKLRSGLDEKIRVEYEHIVDESGSILIARFIYKGIEINSPSAQFTKDQINRTAFPAFKGSFSF